MNSTAWERWENQGIAARTTFWRATPKPGNFSKIKVPKSLLTTIVFQCLLVLVVDSVGDRMGILQQTVLRSRTSLASRAAAIGSATTKATSSDGGSDNRSEEQPEAKPEGNLVPTKRRLRRHSRGRWGRTPSHEGSGRLRSSPGLGRWVRSSHVTPSRTTMACERRYEFFAISSRSTPTGSASKQVLDLHALERDLLESVESDQERPGGSRHRGLLGIARDY